MMDVVFTPDLVDDIARERVIPFLGAGVSASAKTASGNKIKPWAAFLRETAGSLDGKLQNLVSELVNRGEYLLACEILQSKLKDSWEDILTKEYAQKATPSGLHESIVKLNQRIILTTNFDKLLESAFDKLDTDDKYYRTTINSLDSDAFRAFKSHSTKYIVKIHGTIDAVGSLVFSRSEYIRRAFGNQNYSLFMEHLLLNYTFLFIGFSMDDPAISSIMEMYCLKYNSSRPHYVFVPSDTPEYFDETYKNLRKLVSIRYDAADDHKQLPELIQELAKAAEQRKKEIFADMVSASATLGSV